MSGIAIAAIITALPLLIITVLVIFKRLRSRDRLFAMLGVIAAGAAFFGAYYLLRLPLDYALRSVMHSPAHWYPWATTFYAPLTEEPAKWLVLIPLFLTGRVKNDNKGAWAICLGFGFGIGEILFLAQQTALNPQYLALPWYSFSGFFVERVMVCFIHSGLVLIAAQALCSRKFGLMLLAPLFHWLVNIPIFLSQKYPIDAAGIVWGQIIWVWIILFFVAAMVYLGKQFFNSPEKLAGILGRAVCPECGTLYMRSWRGINRIGKRYERCPNCKHSHWTTLYVEDKNKG